MAGLIGQGWRGGGRKRDPSFSPGIEQQNLRGPCCSSEAISGDPTLEPKYKIFLSHSGVQEDFVDHLCKALEEHCLYSIFDGSLESLSKGDNFPDLILKTIQECELFVVVISEEYFTSKWPMVELNAFVQAKKEMQSNINSGILPLFYGLSVSELKDDKRRRRWFEKWETFARDSPKGLIKVDDWKYALDELTKSYGLPYVQGSKQIVEYENEIVSHICKLMTLDIKWEDSHVQGITNEVVIEKMKHMATTDSPSSLLKEVVIEFAGLSNSTVLSFPARAPDAVTIEDDDLRSLQPKRHLTINIINFYIKHLEIDVLSGKDKDRFFFFNCSFFISTFGSKNTSIDIDYEQAWQWIQGVNLFEKDYIFIPIHKSEHWSLIIIYHLSSLARSPTDAHYCSPCIFHLYSVEGKYDDLEGEIRSFIFKAWTKIHQNSDILQALFRMKYVEAEVPQEDNGYDSGIYLLYYMEFFIFESTSPDFSFQTEQGKSLFPRDTSKVLAKRKNIQNLILKLSGMTQLQGKLRVHSSDIFSWLQFKATSEGCIEDVKNNDLTMINGEDVESEHGSHQIGGVTMLNEHQPFDVNKTLTLLGEETRLPQIEEIRGLCHGEESLLQTNNDTLILHKKGENRRLRKSNWSTVETSILLRCIFDFDQFPQRNNATRWNLIVEEVNRVCGTAHTKMQCQYRFDTLAKAFKQVYEFCKKNFKAFSEITEKERLELKLATTLTKEWYTLMSQHYTSKVKYKKYGKCPSNGATSSTTQIQIEVPANCPLSPQIDTNNLLSINSSEPQSEILLEPLVVNPNNHHNGSPVLESFLTNSPPRPLVQRKKSRSDEDEMKGIYRRAIKDIDGGLLRFKYEPRFKPPRDINPLGGFETYNILSLGSYNTLQEAKDVRQIAAYYYGRSDAWLDLGNGTHFIIPDCSPLESQSLCGKDKRIWVQRKVKEVFAAFQLEKARLNLPRKEEGVSLANPNLETQEEIAHGHTTFSSDFFNAGSMVVMQNESRICLEDDSVDRLSEGIWNDPILEPKHKIFLSYSGVQKEFVEHLCKALENRSYYTFFDRRPENLPKGEQYPGLIVQATKQCEMLIVVVSDEYFMSKWPMIELNAFIKAHKLHQESKSSATGPMILPLFYGLSVGDLDNEILGKKWFKTWTSIAKADPKNQIIVSDWKCALHALRSFNGLSYDKNFKEIVAYEEKIVLHVCKSMSLDIRWDDSHVQGKSSILKVIGEKIDGIAVSRRYKVKVVGLYGVAGIGKTTACKILCNKLSSKYEGKVCHIEFPVVPSSDSKEYFQKIFRDLINKSVEVIQHLDGEECKDILRKILFKHRTFLAIDNILDNHQSIQLAKTLLEVPLHMDSLVVVTARSRSVLELLEINGDACLEMPDLEEKDSVKLFLDHGVGGKEFF